MTACPAYGCVFPMKPGADGCALHRTIGARRSPPAPDRRKQEAGRRSRSRVEKPEQSPEPRLVRPPISKEDAPCCAALVDEYGRPPIGYCSAGCVRRPRLDAAP